MPGHTDRWTAPQSCVLTPLLNKDQDTMCPRHFAEILNDLSSLCSSLAKASPSLWQTGQGTQLPQAQGRSARPGQHFTPARTSPSAEQVWLPQTGVAPSALAVQSPLLQSPPCPENIRADSHSHTFAQVAPSPGGLAYFPLPTWVLSNPC